MSLPESGSDDAITVDVALFDAVIFDMDGVVTDTARVHAAAWKRMFDEYLAQLSDEDNTPFAPFDIESDYLAFVDGKPRFDGARSFLDARGIEIPDGSPDDDASARTAWGLSMRKQQYFLDALEAHGARAYPTTIRFIEELRSAGLKTAIITASRNCAEVLDSAGVQGIFDVEVDGNVASAIKLAGKPAPDVFLEAARRLRVEPERAVVVEDARAGVAAGRAGGFGLVVGVDRAGQAEELRAAGAHVVVGDIGELEIAGAGSDRRPGLVLMKNLPWALACLDEIEASIGARTAAFFLDYDGTLTPIVERPEDALMDEGMRSVLRDLAQSSTVAIVSGRDVAFVEEQVRVDGVVYAGSHGFDIVGPVALDSGAIAEFDAFLPLIEEAEAALRLRLASVPGANIERKKYSVAAHYRQVMPARVGEVTAAVDAVVGKEPRLVKGVGKKVYEVRPNIDWDKGRAVVWLFQALGLEYDSVVPVYVGDDITDEDAFLALTEKGIGVAVGSAERPTHARYRLRDPGDVEDFLRHATRWSERSST